MEKDEAMCTYEVETVETFVCPINEGTSYFPHESNCGSFYICTNGIYEKQNCADGLLWSPQLRICNFEHLVECN